MTEQNTLVLRLRSEYVRQVARMTRATIKVLLIVSLMDKKNRDTDGEGGGVSSTIASFECHPFCQHFSWYT